MSSTPRTAAQTPPALSIRKRLLALTALGTGCALSLALLSATTALAAETAPTPPTHGPVGGVKPIVPSQPAPARTPEQQAMLDAIAKAKSTGKPVAVETLTNELSRTVANPNGTLTTTDNAQAVRTKRSGAWTDIDPTLRANGNGTLSPAVATTGLTFSGGGAGPMATVTTGDGKSLAVNAPFPLPKPSVAGANATYSDVLPGVDLQLTALPQGGWRDVIIVRTKEAAQSAALKSLTFPVSAQGLSVAADQSGAITVVDDKGATRFRAPAPLQWDSSKPADPAVAAARASRSAERTVLAAALAPAPTDSAVGIPSTAEEPGDGANVAAITTKVTPQAIELTPNQDALGSGDGPWFLDPSFVAATSYTQGSVEVQENHKDAKNYNLKSNIATGYCGYHSSDPSLDCGSGGRQRAYFQFGINPAIYTIPQGAESAPTIQNATFNGQVTGASSPGTNTPFVIYSAPAGKTIDTNTNWYAQPCGDNGNLVMDGCAQVNGQWLTGTGPLAIDVTDTMKRAAAEKWQEWTIGIAPQASEWEKLYRHYLANNPSITTTYDITPTIWWPRTTPAPGFASNNGTAACNSGGANPWDNPGWVGNNQNIYLTANSWSPAGQNLYTGYHVWDDNDPNFSALPGAWGGSYNDPGPTVGLGSLSDGHQYGWVARVTDETLTSPDSAWCYFRVDKTNPRVSISSTDFPPSGTPNPTPAKYMNDEGIFTVNAEDPAPGAGLQASGVACVRVTADPTPVVGWQCDASTWKPGDPPYTYTPKQWGTNTLYAWAMDNAGNYSQPAVYNFYVPWKPDTQPLFGDVDNDQKPDMVTVDKNGDLRVIGGTTDPTTSLAAPAAAAPNNRTSGATWADYQISHHGTFAIGQAVDAILAHYNKDTTSKLREALYLIPNNGTGRFDTLTPVALNRPACTTYQTGAACPGYNQGNWSNASQVLAIGTPEGEAVGGDPGNANRKVIMTQTSVLSLENNNLYLFQPNGLDSALDTATYIPTASGSWADLELINPGAANGPTTIPGTSDPTNQATVWARNRVTGDLYAYTLGWKADGTVDYAALTKPDQGIKLAVGQQVEAADYPRIGAGDLNNDGTPDLWVMDNTNAISVFPGKSSTGIKGKVDSFDHWAFSGYSDSSVTVQSQLVDWLCMDSIGGPNEGTDIAVYACWQTINQRFNFAIDGTIRSGSWCVSTKGNALGDGTGLMLSRCAGNTGQKWAVRPDGRIYLPATISTENPDGRCLELPEGHTDQGTRLSISKCPTPQTNQQWILTYEKHAP
ncbi:RICIN domain-containing protein [Streptomyces novaecaesareae]|uniref:RICIN domain-containing protein n=1 Tax=Streptomyces novaecaesareae TaxID=68244 RepID=UPI000525E69D|nr:RICIN domain-containing protein [Streptomyces novaecaesareae]